MAYQKSGNIINISSIWGNSGASCETVYSAAKGAVNSFTKALAKEMALSNIRVNAISPGVIDTEMNRWLSLEDKEALLQEIPMMRFGTGEDIGKLAVHINCNDIASCGVEPIGILVTILAPSETTLEEIAEVMKQIDEETKKLNVEILGGHTEITNAVNKLIVSCTAIGKGKLGSAVETAGAKLGDDIVITKKLAMEGSSIIVNDYYDYVKDVLSQEELEEARGYINNLSVVKEGIAAGSFGDRRRRPQRTRPHA
jgi:hydrogenase maturation factor